MAYIMNCQNDMLDMVKFFWNILFVKNVVYMIQNKLFFCFLQGCEPYGDHSY